MTPRTTPPGADPAAAELAAAAAGKPSTEDLLSGRHGAAGLIHACAIVVNAREAGPICGDCLMPFDGRCPALDPWCPMKVPA